MAHRFVASIQSKHFFIFQIPNKMIVHLGMPMKKIDEDLIICDEDTVAVRIWKVVVCHCIIIDPK
jgi:hypothetical protein